MCLKDLLLIAGDALANVSGRGPVRVQAPPLGSLSLLGVLHAQHRRHRHLDPLRPNDAQDYTRERPVGARPAGGAAEDHQDAPAVEPAAPEPPEHS